MSTNLKKVTISFRLNRRVKLDVPVLTNCVQLFFHQKSNMVFLNEEIIKKSLSIARR